MSSDEDESNSDTSSQESSEDEDSMEQENNEGETSVLALSESTVTSADHKKLSKNITNNDEKKEALHILKSCMSDKARCVSIDLHKIRSVSSSMNKMVSRMNLKYIWPSQENQDKNSSQVRLEKVVEILEKEQDIKQSPKDNIIPEIVKESNQTFDRKSPKKYEEKEENPTCPANSSSSELSMKQRLKENDNQEEFDDASIHKKSSQKADKPSETSTKNPRAEHESMDADSLDGNMSAKSTEPYLPHEDIDNDSLDGKYCQDGSKLSGVDADSLHSDVDSNEEQFLNLESEKDMLILSDTEEELCNSSHSLDGVNAMLSEKLDLNNQKIELNTKEENIRLQSSIQTLLHKENLFFIQ